MAFTMISMEIVGITGMFTQNFLVILDIGWELRREPPDIMLSPGYYSSYSGNPEPTNN
tara:strand:+ start:381 stop:554 length:174 start_codon:yes stop_codon:yes gene_type:complete